MTMIREHTDYMTVEEYFAFDEASEIRHEYIDGEVCPMTGGSFNHAAIMMNVGIALGNRLMDSDCRVLGSAMRNRISHTRYLYPDVSVVCGDPDLDAREVTLWNPTLVAEVTSPSTERYDRGRKRGYYQSIASLEVILLVDQIRPFVEMHARQGSSWMRSEYSGMSAIVPLPALNIELPLAELYRGIEF